MLNSAESDPTPTAPITPPGENYDSAQLDHVAAAVKELAHPTQIGPYHILQLIGEGGMGSVYKADQREPLQRTVAVKVIKLGMDTRQVIARFESERQALALMNHPHVARVLDAGATEGGRPYFVMEYVQGEPITAFADRHRLTVRQRLELFIQGCDAVQHAHQKAIIHRDLKPSNILVMFQDGKPWVKVIDFGVAKAVSQRLTEKTYFTETGQLVGTPEYMAPEQAEANALDIDTRSDVYSLGVVLYELLSGALPFDSKSLRSAGFNEIQRIIREVDPPRPSTKLSSLGNSATEVARARQIPLESLARQLKGELEWIPLKAMRKDRSNRYATPTELAEDIRSYLSNKPLRAGPESAAYRLQKFLRRNRRGVVASAAMVLLLLTGIVTTSWQAIRARRAERQTRAALVEVREQKKQVEDANSANVAVIDFLTRDVLGSSIPEVTRGRPLTVQEALDNSARTIGERFKSTPQTRSAVLTAIAEAYLALGRADLALPHAQAAVDLCRGALPADHPATIAAVHALGEILERLGRSSEAEPLYQEAIDKTRQVYGPDHKYTIVAIRSLGNLRMNQGRLEEAETLVRQSLEAAQGLPESDQIVRLGSLHSLALVLRTRGKYADAEQILRQTTQLAPRLLGDDHPDTLNYMNTLGAVLQVQGKRTETETIKRDIVAKARRVFGEEHYYTILMLQSYADILSMQGKHDQAEPLFREALDKARRGLGRDHHLTLAVVNNFAIMLDKVDKWEEADVLYRECVELGKLARGTEHPDVIISMLVYSRALRKHDRLPEAETLGNETLANARKVFGADHAVTMATEEEMARIFQAQSRPAQAEPILRELRDRRRRALGDDHPDTLESLDALAGFLLDEKRYAEAEAIAEELYRRSAAADIGVHPAARKMLKWPASLAAQGKWEPCYVPLLEIRQRLFAGGLSASGTVQDVLAALIAVCNATNRAEEAARYQAELAAATSQPTTAPTTPTTAP